MSRADSPLKDRVIFLVGVRRSGTNWLARLLGLHPDVVVLPSETHLLSDGIFNLQRSIQHGLPTSPHTGTVFLDRRQFLDLARDLCDAAFKCVADAIDPAARRVLERTPMHIRHLGLIGEVYPDATVVHLIRDGRDVVRSLVAQDWGPATVQEAALEWRQGILSARGDATSLRSYHEVRYEEFLSDPVSRMLRLYEQLGLAVDDEVAGQVMLEAPVAFNTDSEDPRIGQGKWKETWSSDDRAVFDRVAGALLSDLGYTTDGAEVAHRTSSPFRAGSASARPTSAPQRDLNRSLQRKLGQVSRLAGRRYSRRRIAPGHRMDRYQHAVDRFFAHLAAGRVDAAAGLLSPSGRVRVVTSDRTRERRGAAARQLLLEALQERNSVLSGVDVPLRSEVVVVVNEFTVLLTFPGTGGPVDEVFILRIGDDDTVQTVRYFRFPLVAPPVVAATGSG